MTEDNLSTFENESLSLTVNKQPGCRVQMEIKVTKQATEKAYSDALKAVNKEVSLPGFRKGKAPTELILRHFQKHVDSEWREKVLQKSFEESLRLSQLTPFDQNRIKAPQIKKLSREEGTEFSIEFEAEPQVPAIDVSDIAIAKRDEKPVTQEQIDKEIFNFKTRHAEWDEVKGRPVAEGDFVDLNIEILSEPKEMVYEKHRFDLGAMQSWLKEAVLGAEEGAQQEALFGSEEVENPEVDLQQVMGHQIEIEKAHQGKACRVTVLGIFTRRLPELSDELAKKEGYESVDELKQSIHDYLQREGNSEGQEARRQELKTILLQRYPFDLPASLIEQEKKRIERMKGITLKQKGVADSEIDSEVKAASDQIEQQAKETLLLSFLLRKVAVEANITIYQEELLKEMLRLYTKPSEELPIDPTMSSDEIRNRVVIKLMTNKSLDHLLEQKG